MEKSLKDKNSELFDFLFGLGLFCSGTMPSQYFAVISATTLIMMEQRGLHDDYLAYLKKMKASGEMAMPIGSC